MVDREGNGFWLGKHYALVGRTDGYANDCLFCRYTVSEEGFVSVEYRFGKMRSLLIPFLVSLAVGLFFLGATVFDGILDGSWNFPVLGVGGLFLILGVVGLIVPAGKKDRADLVSHLERICRADTAE